MEKAKHTFEAEMSHHECETLTMKIEQDRGVIIIELKPFGERSISLNLNELAAINEIVDRYRRASEVMENAVVPS